MMKYIATYKEIEYRVINLGGEIPQDLKRLITKIGANRALLLDSLEVSRYEIVSIKRQNLNAILEYQRITSLAKSCLDNVWVEIIPNYTKEEYVGAVEKELLEWTKKYDEVSRQIEQQEIAHNNLN